ncbi:tetratricopeptide repeat protein [Nicoletella semolina]|uniref:Tetratricopeptide repeat protein n=1 Tax=Nicoletella semolina TaxID=271160 RepID=A0A4R2N9E9_9PAST|nr:hypothetical protein [Nicoletella semolina]MDH2925556.1 hypothetical protein [Nicoletella semolina]TCP17620.1 tetratricopeptide repeat protein [Nicoletella semolina]
MKSISFILFILPSTLLAETLSTPKPLFFEDKSVQRKQAKFAKNSPNLTANTPMFTPIEQANWDQTITTLLVNKQWQALKIALEHYAKQANFDPILYRYAKGAMLRAEQNYDGAIQLYQQLLQAQPQLAYPRFDLGVMLFENKQYHEAKQQLNQAKNSLEPQMQPLVERYLQAIKERQSWQPDAELQYTQTNNANNASSEREVEIGGLRFVKNSDSLPQKAQGVRYGLGASREINLSGNHFVVFEGRFSGIHYWNNREHSEKSLYSSFGYRKLSALQSWGILPFFEQNWLASPRYSRNFGVNVEFHRQLTRQWRLSANFNHTQKRYTGGNIAKRYNGHMSGLSTSLSYQANANWVIFGGLEVSKDRVKDKAESSIRKGINVGTLIRFGNFASCVGLRYVKRNFLADNFYFPKKRIDSEYSVNTSLWHNQIRWKGFVPKLNYRYRKVDSNITAFYSRSNSEWFINVEKVW